MRDDDWFLCWREPCVAINRAVTVAAEASAAEIARLQEQMETLKQANDDALRTAIEQSRRAEAAEAERDRLEAEREQDAERWLADKAALDTCREVLHKAKAFHDRDSGCNGFTADYEILRYEIEAALQKEPQP
ncbi:MAG: hypothetical protein ACTHKQ_17890 [Mesorhizobium sp.]